MLGVAPSVLPNTRLLAAVNIVSGDPDVIKRVYLSTEHAAHGFYVLRFFQEDPRSDDDWKGTTRTPSLTVALAITTGRWQP